MAYRQTPRMRARLEATRERLVAAALECVAQGGWAAATVAGVARRAGVATGTVYRHVEGRDALLAEAFTRAAGREFAAVEAAAGGDGPPSARIEAALRTFATRALRRRRLAYALLAEPAAPSVEAARLAYRRGYRALFADLVAECAARGELGPCDPDVVAAVLTGAMGESLVGPLAPAVDADAPDETVDELVRCCLRALPRSPEEEGHR